MKTETHFAVTWELNSLKAQTEPVAVDEAILKKYVGRYGPGEVVLENGRLLTLIDDRKLKMIPLSPTYFVVDGEVEIHVEFIPAKDGGAFEVIVYNHDGGTQCLGRQAPAR